MNALAALATVAPCGVLRAAGRWRQFLRASFDQEERALVLLEEELAVVSAYLDIESLVENPIQHGFHSSPRARRVELVVRAPDRG